MIECVLEVGGAEFVGHMTIGRVRQEEFALCIECGTDVLLSDDVLLTAIHHSHVA